MKQKVSDSWRKLEMSLRKCPLQDSTSNSCPEESSPCHDFRHESWNHVLRKNTNFLRTLRLCQASFVIVGKKIRNFAYEVSERQFLKHSTNSRWLQVTSVEIPASFSMVTNPLDCKVWRNSSMHSFKTSASSRKTIWYGKLWCYPKWMMNYLLCIHTINIDFVHIYIQKVSSLRSSTILPLPPKGERRRGRGKMVEFRYKRKANKANVNLLMFTLAIFSHGPMVLCFPKSKDQRALEPHSWTVQREWQHWSVHGNRRFRKFRSVLFDINIYILIYIYMT